MNYAAFTLWAEVHPAAASTTNVFARDGSFEMAFAGGGHATFKITPPYDLANVARELTDGRLLVAGNCQVGFCLTRLNPDGLLDKSYGIDGTGTVQSNPIAGGPLDLLAYDMVILSYQILMR